MYTYDETTGHGSGIGRLTTERFNQNASLGAGSYSYSYDVLNRLTSSPLGSYSYGTGMAPGSNTPLHGVAVVNSNGGTSPPVAGGHGQGPKITLPGPPYSALYDAAGDMVCRSTSTVRTLSCLSGVNGGAQLGYDNERRLTSWQNAPTSPATTVAYAYDGEGQRVAQQVTTSGTSTTTYYIAGLEEQTGSTLTKYYSVPGVVSAVSVGGTLSYLASDGLGSVSEALGTNGAATAQTLYSPYGNARYSSGSMPTARGFTGQYGDATTGLDYFNARYYDPSVGQFGSPDSVADGLNRYGYVAGNPETLTDPSGHRVCDGGDGCNGGDGGGDGGGGGGGDSGGGCYSENCGGGGCYVNCGGGHGGGGSGGSGDGGACLICAGTGPLSTPPVTWGNFSTPSQQPSSCGWFTQSGCGSYGLALQVGNFALPMFGCLFCPDQEGTDTTGQCDECLVAHDNGAGFVYLDSDGPPDYHSLGPNEILSNGQTNREFSLSQPTCFYCGGKVTPGMRGGIAPVTEHVYPNSLAKQWIDTQEEWNTYLRDVQNLVVSCTSCNSAKGSKSFGNWTAVGGFRPGAEEEGLEIWNATADRYGFPR